MKRRLTKFHSGFALAAFSLLATACASSNQHSKSSKDSLDAAGCPVMGDKYRHTAAGSLGNDDWWPNQLNLDILHQHSERANPMDADFNYAEAFANLDLATVKRDIEAALTDSQDWWPADWGHYGPLMIRLAWHSAGTYRTSDGRGGSSSGTIRFAPLNSWPDNGNLDKARRLLWPIKQKYGRSISWADLMILTGNVALESMGFETLGFAGGREDVWEPEKDIFWGPETEWLAQERFSEGDELSDPLGAVQMGLIYVNPQGPGGNMDLMHSAQRIRETFGRMAMNDEETVALIAGGHTFGKGHGAAGGDNVGVEPEGAPVENQGFGWMNAHGSGKGGDTITSGLEGAWTTTPTEWSTGYFDNLFRYEWEMGEAPSGAKLWRPKDGAGKDTVPDAHDFETFHQPVMFTTDLALITDPAYLAISKRFHENPAAFADAFARAWYKLTHRDMGPVSRLLGPEVPPAQLWQDPVPPVDHPLIGASDIANLKRQILNSGLSVRDLVSTAWASASTYRGTDRRGGANGARVRLAPQNGWDVNEPRELRRVLNQLGEIRTSFNDSLGGGKKVSMADVIVLGGAAAIESAAKAGGMNVSVPFAPGRTDATPEMTDAESFDVLEPKADGFRNYSSGAVDRALSEMLVDRSHKLGLSAPEMTVLLAGLRVLDTNYDDSNLGVFTKRPGVLSNDFLVNLLDMRVEWSRNDAGTYEGRDRKTGDLVWTATEVDLVFGSNSQLRAIAERYASDDAKADFANDFVAAWTKVMQLDRFDLHR